MSLTRLLVLTVIFAVVHSAPYTSEDVVNQLLSDLLAAKHSREASHQGIRNVLPWPFHSFSLPYGSSRDSNAQHEIKFNKDIFLMLNDILSTDRARSSMLNKQVKGKFLSLFSKILGEISDMQDELRSNVNSRRDRSSKIKGSRMSDISLAKSESTTDNMSNETIKIPTFEKETYMLIENYFTCLVKHALPGYSEVLKKLMNFGNQNNSILKGLQELLTKTDFKSYYKTLLGLLSSILPHSESVSREIVQIEQAIDYWDLLNSITRNMIKKYAEYFKDDEGHTIGIFGNSFNMVRLLMQQGKLNAEDKASFNSSIHFFLNYIFKLIDDMEFNQEVKNALKWGLKHAIDTGLPAFLKEKNGEKLSHEEHRNTLLKSYVTAFAVLNVVLTKNSSLFNIVEEFLSKHPTNEELSTKAQCLLSYLLRNTLEFLINFESKDEIPPIQCGIDGIKEGFRMMLPYFPKDLNTVGGCEGFDKKWEVAQKDKKLNQLMMTSLKLPLNHWG